MIKERTVVRVGNLRVLESDGVNSIVITPTNTPNGQSMPTRAGTTTERNLRPRVNSDTIILIINLRPGNNNIITLANIKPIGIMPAFVITGGVINRHIGDGQPIASVDANSLHGRVLNVQIRNRRVGQVVRVEELGFRFPAVAPLGIPPARPVRVELCAGGALDGDAVAFDLEERAGPFFVAPGCGAFENDLHTAVNI
jgi:hypothetical protein